MVRRISLLALLVVLGCQTNPITGRRQFLLLTEEDEIAFGNRYAAALLEEMNGLYDDPALQALVEDVGRKLVAQLPAIARGANYSSSIEYRFYVVNDSQINAFALMGGHIYFTRGILTEMRSEDEVAAVMGHEIMHIAGKHTAASLSREVLLAPLAVVPLLHALKSLHYSRKDESQSDKYGQRLMVAAGYNPQGMVDLFEFFTRMSGGGGVEWLSSHPLSEDRYAEASRRCQEQYAEACSRPKKVDAFNRAVARAKAEKPIYEAYDQGIALMGKKDYAGAIRCFDQAISRKRDPIFFRDRGLAKYYQRQIVDAERDLTEAIRLNVKMMKPFLYRGAVRRERGDARGALADLREANARIESSLAHYLIGLAYEDVSNAGMARNAYYRALELEGFAENGLVQPPNADSAEYLKDAYNRYRRLS